VSAAGIGWVVDDGCAPKRSLGGPDKFAASLASGEPPVGHLRQCPSCQLIGEELACVGVVEPLVSARAEEWLLRRLPADLESLPGSLLAKHLQEAGVEGKGGEELRKRGLFEAPGPFARHWGSFFRRTTVTTDQLFEELFCAGDVQPAHALGVLLHVGGVAVDGSVPHAPADGARLSALFETPASRRERVLCTLSIAKDDDRSVRELVRFLRAAWAAFVLDCELRVFCPV
jgi:hypothetical protein